MGLVIGPRLGRLGWGQASAATYLGDLGEVALPLGRTHMDLLWEQESTVDI